MKLTFPLPQDEKMHRYCFSCHTEGAIQVKDVNKTRYHCHHCGATNDRAIYFNDHAAWLDDERTLWHESAGVFVRRPDGTFLFFKRTEFPFVLTVPAGHVDKGEDPKGAAARELREETGLEGELTLLGTADISGDSCSAGADDHRWHAFLLGVNEDENVVIFEEGEKALWLSLDEAKQEGLAYVIDEVITRYRSILDR